MSYGALVEAEELFAESPALASLSYEDRLGLATVAFPVALAPGEPVVLDRGDHDSGDHAVVIAAGVIVTPNGRELVRGTLIGPTGERYRGPVAAARTPVRLFSLPGRRRTAAAARLRARPARARPRAGRPGVRRSPGSIRLQSYPPLAVPPGPPPPDLDPTADRRFEKKLRWLLLLVLLLALFITGGNVLGAVTAWAEMPSDKALLQVQTGTATAVVDGTSFPLSAGDDIYVGASDTVTVDPRSRALMIYRGGATSLLCAGTRLEGRPARQRRPAGRPGRRLRAAARPDHQRHRHRVARVQRSRPVGRDQRGYGHQRRPRVLRRGTVGRAGRHRNRVLPRSEAGAAGRRARLR
jgi:putative peptide zinc metalloprotease protein